MVAEVLVPLVKRLKAVVPVKVPLKVVALTVPATSKRADGAVVPIPKLPLSKTTNLSMPAVSWVRKVKPVPLPLERMWSLAAGAVAPMPVLELK